ncbi:MAG: low molecular weight phosphotyrosine protein phosphatase [Clostridiales bacterium]|nr:low molecular weight phosphotyrosine protein phosphatase [Clostridiales bacterium]
MRRILFICFGNICRSPMAEFIMKALVIKRGLQSEFYIESRGTSAEDFGHPVNPPAAAELKKRGIGCAGKTAMQLRPEDYEAFDLLIAMDGMNARDVRRITGGDPQGKLHMMMEHTSRGGDVDDPWFTQRYDVACRDILEGCESWLERLTTEQPRD